MRNSEFSPPGMVRCRPSSFQEEGTLNRFEELAMPLFPSLYNLARWLAQDANDAEDLVQETYLKALRSFASFEPGSNFRAWLFKILKNTFLGSRSKLERRLTNAMDGEEELTMLSATPESMLIGRCDADAVQTAIEQLPPIFREVILLSDVEEASYREISEILSIPMGTVMSRLARARKKVRESLPSAGAREEGENSRFLGRRNEPDREPSES